ncbi:MAG: hypothetical protein GXX83_06165 [Gaiellales bacterium]|nr:hypothetical protein [Gaiellales bacterium]
MTALSRCKTAIRRPILFLALVCLIGLAGCGNAPTAEKWTMDASWAYGTRTIKTQTETAEIIAVGEVTKVDPARWNSPDGKQWEPKEEGSLAMVYTTFYVQPTRLLKGESKFGTPIPFRVVGGIIGDTGQAANAGADAKFSTIASGQQVIVFGLDDHRFGSECSWTPAAYWLPSDVNSMWRMEGDTYNCLGQTDLEGEQRMARPDLEAAISGYLSTTKSK